MIGRRVGVCVQATEELEGVRSVHDETVRKWQSSRSSSAEQTERLRAEVTAARAELAERSRAADAAAQRALHHVTMLTVDRETLQKKLDTSVFPL